MSKPPNGRRILLSTVSSDAHTWNLIYLQLLLTEHGNEVTNLGACVPTELLISTAVADGPDLIVISSINGHGFAEGLRLIEEIRATDDLCATPVVIGGKLGVAGPLAPEQVARLSSAGFDAVFGDETDLSGFLGFVAGLPNQPALSKSVA